MLTVDRGCFRQSIPNGDPTPMAWAVNWRRGFIGAGLFWGAVIALGLAAWLIDPVVVLVVPVGMIVAFSVVVFADDEDDDDL